MIGSSGNRRVKRNHVFDARVPVVRAEHRDKAGGIVADAVEFRPRKALNLQDKWIPR